MKASDKMDGSPHSAPASVAVPPVAAPARAPQLDASPRRSTRARCAQEVRQLLALLDGGDAHDLPAVQDQAFSCLARWASQQTAPPFAGDYRRLLQREVETADSGELARQLRGLTRAQRRWAQFLLEQAADVRAILRARRRQRRAEVLGALAVDVAQLDKPELRPFAFQGLTRAAALIGRASWAQLILFRPALEPDQSRALRGERVFTLVYKGGRGRLAPQRGVTGHFEVDHPPITSDLILRSAHGHTAIIAEDPSDDLAPWLGWRARSLICAPVARRELARGEAFASAGVVLVAARQPGQFTAEDADALTRCGELIALGLERIAELKGRRDWIHQVMHDLSKTMRPLLIQVRDIQRPLRDALSAPDLAAAAPALRDAMQRTMTIANLVFLTNDLMYWAADLTDEVTLPEDDTVTPLDCAAIARELQPSTTTLGQVTTGRPVHWHLDAAPLFVAGGETRENLIKAVLFKYIENGLKYGSRQDVHVSITAVGRMVEFAVGSTGEPLDDAEIPLLFEHGFRGARAGRMSAGFGFGLAQVKRIAHLLGGTVGYRAEGQHRNVFWLRLPAVPAE